MARTEDSGKAGRAIMLAAAACVIVAGLYFAKAVLVPLILAVLFSFLLTPLVSRLERLRLRRAPSVLLVVILALSLVGLLGWVMKSQFVQIANKLPDYREEITSKIARLRGSTGGLGEAASKIERTVKEVAMPSSTQPATTSTAPSSAGPGMFSPPQSPTATPGAPTLPQVTPQNPLPVRSYPSAPTSVENVSDVLVRLLHPLATAGIVTVFTIFMMLKREDLRDRMIRLISRGPVNFTTQALDEGMRRISRYLLAQSLVNVSYAIAVMIGLWTIGRTLGREEGGFPNVVLWGLLAGLMRFIPYVGPWIGAAFPLALSFGFFHHNGVFFATLGMFVGLELLVSQFVEPFVYGSSTGLSTMAILVSAVFWTSVWGPVGLLLSTPLTVVLVVIGKYVPQMQFLSILLGDEPALSPPQRVYQRLLALDDEEAAELAETYLKDNSLEKVYDELLIQVLAMVEQDRQRGKLDEGRQRFIHQSMRDMVEELGDLQHDRDAGPHGVGQAVEKVVDKVVDTVVGRPAEKAGDATRKDEPAGSAGCTITVLCLPAKEPADEIAVLMLAQLLTRRGYCAESVSADALVSEMVTMVGERQADIVCISAVPPGAVARARYLGKRLCDKYPQLKIAVGLWTLVADLAKVKSRLAFITTGQIATTLAEAQEQIDRLARSLMIPPPEPLKPGPA